MQDRLRGTLIGLAVGDALGAAVEFRPPGTFEPVVCYRSGGPHGLEPGEWTDDTSMALALADSLATVGWDLHDQLHRYVRWWREGKYSVNGRCFDIGIATRSALARFRLHGDPLQSGDPDESSSGNGSIMRLAPVPIRYAGLFPASLEELARLATESSLTTHASEQCLSACRYLTLVLAALQHGLDRDAVLAPDWEPLVRLMKTTPLHLSAAAVAAGSFRELAPTNADQGLRLGSEKPGTHVVGLSRRPVFRGGRAAGRQFGRRRRHDRRRVRSASRLILGRIRSAAALARRLGGP